MKAHPGTETCFLVGSWHFANVNCPPGVIINYYVIVVWIFQNTTPEERTNFGSQKRKRNSFEAHVLGRNHFRSKSAFAGWFVSADRINQTKREVHIWCMYVRIHIYIYIYYIIMFYFCVFL